MLHYSEENCKSMARKNQNQKEESMALKTDFGWLTDADNNLMVTATATQRDGERNRSAVMQLVPFVCSSLNKVSFIEKVVKSLHVDDEDLF